MAKNIPSSPTVRRDGKSQPARQLAALDPAHARVDERSALDLLTFAREYGEQLVYYNDKNEREKVGDKYADFSAFLDKSFDLNEVAELVADPEALIHAQLRAKVRPHLALFLVFLKLLERTTGHLNTLTRRHLEFYYGDVLGLSRRGPAPDHVHVLAKLARSKEEVLLPAGTLLDGGKDSQGKDRAYRTDRDVIVSRAQVARLSSVFAERRVTTLRSAREQSAADPKAAFLEMLRFAFGAPRPGDDIPKYEDTRSVDAALLQDLTELVSFVKAPHLFMEFYDLERLVSFLKKREVAKEAAEWSEVNGYLQAAGRLRRADPGFTFSPAAPDDFENNFFNALDLKDFSDVPGVVTVKDLYIQHERGAAGIDTYIKNDLKFAIDDFTRMMKIATQISAEWSEIHRIIESAGQSKRPLEIYRLEPTKRSNFEKNFTDALGIGAGDWPGTGITSVTEYHEKIKALEAAFFMPVEDFAYLMAIYKAAVDNAAKISAPAPTAEQWSRVYEILEEAHADKEIAARKEAIKLLGSAAATAESGLRAMLLRVLGEAPASENVVILAGKLIPFLGNTPDFNTVRSMAVNAMAGEPITSDDWDEIARIIELAERLRDGGETPAAQTREWLDLHTHEDATKVQTSLGLEADGETPRWRTFGAARAPRAVTDPPPPAVLGWAVFSPLLALQEGERTVTLTLGFEAEGFDAARINDALNHGPFEVALSTAKGYRSVTFSVSDHATPDERDYQKRSGVTRALPAPLSALQLVIKLGEEDEPVVALPAEEGASEGAQWPSLRLMLRPVWDALRNRYITLYEAFERLVLAAVHIKVEAKGLRAFTLENDISVIDAKKPFTLFGVSPAVGSRFYVAHPELCQKRLDTAAFHLQWMKAPEDLTKHYKPYNVAGPDFKADIALLDHRRELKLVNGAPLFNPAGAQLPHSIPIAAIPAPIEPASAASAHSGEDRPASARDRAFVWELKPFDFQHQKYPRLASSKGAELAAKLAVCTAGAAPVDTSDYQVEAPYTPTLKSLEAEYTASAETLLDATLGAGEDRIHHVFPFGESEVPLEAGRGAYFLPRHDTYDGELYIGLRDVHAPQSLPLLFQMAEGSADPDLETAVVEWSYLSGNQWVSLHNGGILADGTRGLLSTGILDLSLPKAAPSTRLPGDLYWLRAAVRENVRSIPDVVAIHTQVVPATFLDRGNAPDCYDAPLPPGTITKFLAPVRGVAGVEQPYASFGGSPAERDRSFATRVSERLRHKQRALSTWDYEHLVLERFPRIYKVKCIPAGASERDHAGSVRLVVIPAMKNQIPFDPFEPKAPAGLLRDIAAYVSDKTPPEARVVVQNAVFIGVRVRILVRFSPGCDEGFYKKKLDDEISRFLSPWAYDDGVDIVMGNRIYASSIVDFVERRPYIDFIAGITLFKESSAGFDEVERQTTDGYHVPTLHEDEVLVSARGHEIDTSWQYLAELSEEELEKLRRRGKVSQKGIGWMTISLDFIIGPTVLVSSGAGIEDMGIEVNFVVG